MVFDAYWKDSLKAAIRRNRGKCIRRHMDREQGSTNQLARVSACRREQVRAVSYNQ